MEEKHTAWIFDVDGVLTNPKEKKFIDTYLLEQFATWLKSDTPIALNTGRSLKWVEDQFLEPLKELISPLEKGGQGDFVSSPISPLANLIIVGEKGADLMTFDEQGHPHQTIDKTISVTHNLVRKIKNLVEEEFSDTMFFDETKKTMISIEVKHEANLEHFHEEQNRLIETLNNIIQDNQLTIDHTFIATDIQNPHTGKALGVQRILHWYKERGFHPTRFYTFGDSSSDIEMAKELSKTYSPSHVTFIFVGPNLPWQLNELPFEVKHIPGFDRGTITFLKTS